MSTIMENNYGKLKDLLINQPSGTDTFHLPRFMGAPILEKQFNYQKSNKPVEIVQKLPELPVLSIRKKKRRRRRRKNKKKIQKCQTAARQRKVSITESDDSLVICFEDKIDLIHSDNETETDPASSSDSFIPLKKVRFSDNCEVHTMFVWPFAYQAARKSHWEQYARDRDRFMRRIKDLKKVLGPIFKAEHRTRIYEERFAEK